MKEEYKNCSFREYEYKFKYNGETYIADYCYSGKLGSYCEKDDITYHNVEYMSTIVGCNDNKENYSYSNNLGFIAFLLIGIISIYILFNYFKVFIRCNK